MTHFDAERAYDFLKRLSFVRSSGSEDERRAAEVIAGELRRAGLRPGFEEFPVWTYEEEPSRVEVLTPYRSTIEAAPVGLTGTTPAEGLTAGLVFVETGEEEFLDDVAGKVALTYGSLRAKKYEALTEAEAAAAIVIGEAGKDLSHLSVFDTYFKRFGKLPAVYVRYEDGLRMVQERAREVTVVCRQKETEGQSRNVVVEIPGTGPRADEELIVLGGHYDTVPTSAGAHDNAGGSAILVELAVWLAKHPARRTVRLVWFGAEELGLYGSRAYVAAHEKELGRLKLLVNVDVAGGTIGRNHCTITGPESLKAYLDVLGKELGVGLETKLGNMSSDGMPFGDKGVPSVNFARYGGGTSNLHTRHDTLEHTDAGHLAMLGRLVEVFVDRVANARAYPFEREIPESVKKDIAKYREESIGLEKEDAAKKDGRGAK